MAKELTVKISGPPAVEKELPGYPFVIDIITDSNVPDAYKLNISLLDLNYCIWISKLAITVSSKSSKTVIRDRLMLDIATKFNKAFEAAWKKHK